MQDVQPQAAPKRTGAKIAIWFVAVVATVFVAGYQRRTGPTYPLSVSAELGGAHVSGQLLRSHPGAGGPKVEILAEDASISGDVLWQPFESGKAWDEGVAQRVPLARTPKGLRAELGHFEPAYKIAYVVELRKGSDTVRLPDSGPAVLRYRGDVPAWVLIPHILFIFAGLLMGMRITIAALFGEPSPQWWFRLLIPAMLLGGFVFGPLMSWFGFGEFWTGWPMGQDVTDSKTLATMVAWLVAWFVATRWASARRAAIILAMVVMLGVYLVPHSVLGSERSWATTPTTSNR